MLLYTCMHNLFSWPFLSFLFFFSLCSDHCNSSSIEIYNTSFYWQDNSKNVNYVQISTESYAHFSELEDQVKILNEKLSSLNEKLSSAQSEMINKDNLVKQHAKVAEEAVSGITLFFHLPCNKCIQYAHVLLFLLIICQLHGTKTILQLRHCFHLFSFVCALHKMQLKKQIYCLNQSIMANPIGSDRKSGQKPNSNVLNWNQVDWV